MKYKTAEQLLRELNGQDYIIVKTDTHEKFAIPVKAIMVGMRRSKTAPKKKISIVKWMPCTFNEYINLKLPFHKIAHLGIDPLTKKNL